MRWAIPVASVAVFGAVATLLAQEAKREKGKAAPAVAADRLPTLGTVGDLPPEKERLVVEVDAKGRVTVEGAALDLAGFRKLLAERADASREETGKKVSRLHIVIRADRDLPWQGAQWLMQECATPGIRVNRILFAALPEDGGEEGAVATFLPVDVGLGTGDPRPEAEVLARVGVRLRYRPEGDDARPADISPRIRGFVAKDPLLTGEIEAAPATPTGIVLGMLDAMLRAGVRSIVFRGTTLQTGASLERAVAAVPAPVGKLAVTVLDTRLFRSKEPVLLAPVARVKGALAGVTEAPVPVLDGPVLEQDIHDAPETPPK